MSIVVNLHYKLPSLSNSLSSALKFLFISWSCEVRLIVIIASGFQEDSHNCLIIQLWMILALSYTDETVHLGLSVLDLYAY